MADPISVAIQSVHADHLERSMAVECMAEFCDYDRAASVDVFSGVAKGILAARNDFDARG